jgi:hypothetical protein
MTDDQIPSAAQWNEAGRAGSRELLNMLLRMFSADTDPADNTGLVLGGLLVDNVVGTLRSSVAKGVGFWYDSTLYTDPLSPLGLIYLEADDTTSAVHSAGDAANPRIDVVWIKTVAGTDNNQMVLQDGGGSILQDIFRRGQVTVGVTEGVAAGVPAAPATPADSMKLAEVLVPALAANLDAATYTDSRIYVDGPRRRSLNPIEWYSDAVHITMSYLATADHGTVRGARGWNTTEEYPEEYRGPAAVPAGDSSGYHFPMMVPAARTWWANAPASLAQGTFTSADITVVESYLWRIVHATGNAAVVVAYIPCPGQARGTEVVDAQLTYSVGVVLGGGGTVTARMYVCEDDGTQTAMGAAVTLSNLVGTYQDTITVTTPYVLLANEHVYCLVTVNFQAVADAAALNFFDLAVQFQEGRA